MYLACAYIHTVQHHDHTSFYGTSKLTGAPDNHHTGAETNLGCQCNVGMESGQTYSIVGGEVGG